MGRVLERDPIVNAVLASAHGCASASQEATVLLAGEPGIGKSTLADLIATQLLQRESGPPPSTPWSVVRARGRSSARSRPLETLGTALARLLHGVAPDVRATLVTGLPALRAVIDGLDEPADGQPDDRMHKDGTRLSTSCAVLLTRLAARGPVLMLVDDLHWADDASVELLEYLWDELRDVPVLWLLTFRSVEADDRDDVRRLVSRVERSPRTQLVAVPRLSASAVAELCGSARPDLPAGIRATMAKELLHRSQGNPLVVDALLRADHLRTEGSGALLPDAVPRYVADVFADQLALLDPSEALVLVALAVADAAESPSELAELVADDHRGVVAAVESLVSRGLARRTATGRTEVAHPVVAEVALVRHAGDAQRLHAARFRRPPLPGAAEDPAERARHASGAGALVADADAAVALHAAALDARRRRAREAELRWLIRAAERARLVADEAERAALLVPVLLDLARAWEGNPEAALAAAEEACGVASAQGQHGLAAEAAASMARSAWSVGMERRAEQYADRAVALAAAGSPIDLLWAEEARLRILGLLARGASEIEAAVAATAQAAERAGRPERGRLAAAVGRISLATVDASVFDDAAAWSEIIDAEVADDDRSRLASTVISLRQDWAHVVGDWAHARAALDDERLVPWRALTSEIDLLLSTGAWDTAVEVLAGARGLGASHVLGLLEEWVAVLRGDPLGPLASAGLEHDVTRRLLRAYRDALAGVPVDPAALSGFPLWFTALEGPFRQIVGELAVAVADDATLDRTIEMLRPRVTGTTTRVAGSAALLDGWRRHANGDAAGARDRFLDAAAAFDAVSMPVEAARARMEAEAVLPGPDRDAVLSASLDRFVRVGAQPWAARARALVAAAGPATRVTRSPSPLTGRELEVARLVARGLTNAQIATELFVSVRTVTSHLDHAYTKLGIGSRAALTAFVVGLDREG